MIAKLRSRGDATGIPGRVIRGICEGDSDPQLFIPKLIDFYLAGRFPFDRLLSAYAFDRINDAVADALAGKVIKPVLMIPQDTH